MWVEFDGVRHHVGGVFKGDIPILADQFELGLTGGLHNVNYGRGGAFSPDKSVFAGLHRMLKDLKGGQGVLSLWNPTNGERIGTISRGANHPISAFAWSPDGKEIAVAYGDSVRVYLTNPKILAGIDAGDDPGPFKRMRSFDVKNATALAWSQDGKTLAVGRTVWQYKEGSDGRSNDVIAFKID